MKRIWQGRSRGPGMPAVDPMGGAGRRPRGFVLMEVVVAIAFFGIAGLGLSRALNEAAKKANLVRIEAQMLNRLQSALTEASRSAQLEEGEFVLDPDALGIIITVQVVPMEEMVNSQDQVLQDMWLIRCIGQWERNEQVLEMTAETYRYLPLYQPQ